MNNGKREVIPRSEYEYSLEVQAEAVALALAFGNCSDAAREMARRYPERPPGRNLIWRWAKKIEPEQFTTLQQERKEAVQNRAVDLALLSADKLEDELDAGNIKGQPLAVTYGISTDKALKLLEIEKRGGGGDTINILALVNAKAKELEDELDAEGRIVEGKARPLPDKD